MRFQQDKGLKNNLNIILRNLRTYCSMAVLNYKSCHLDPVPTWLIKNDVVMESVISTLVSAINGSLESDVVPASPKTAVVTPLIKKGGSNSESHADYRPVSSLSFVSKLLERVVFDQVIQHLDDNILQDPYQSA